MKFYSPDFQGFFVFFSFLAFLFLLNGKKQNSIVGHIMFFSGMKPSASVKAWDFVTAYEVNHEKFMQSLHSSSFEEKVLLCLFS